MYTNICGNCKKTFQAKHPSREFCYDLDCLRVKSVVWKKRNCERNKKRGTIKSVRVKAKDGIFHPKCLRCNKVFRTTNKFNRVCKRCTVNNSNIYCEELYGAVIL